MIDIELPSSIQKEVLVFTETTPLKFPLVDKFYQSQGYKIKCGRNERVFTLSNESNDFIAAARLVPQTPSDYLLRNLLVAIDWRSQGLGKFFMQKVLQELKVGTCYCFSLVQVEQFYLDLHFRYLEPEQCNAQIAKLYQQYRSRGRDWKLMGYQQNPDQIFQSTS